MTGLILIRTGSLYCDGLGVERFGLWVITNMLLHWWHLNSIFQILFFSTYAWLFLYFLPPYFGVAGQVINVDFWTITHAVLVYLGIPFFLGFTDPIHSSQSQRFGLVSKCLLTENQPTEFVGFIVHDCGDV